MSSTYDIEITVEKDDLDELQHVNNVRYVQWIQDISKEHWISAAPDAMRSDVIWVVMHHDITYKASAQLGDSIRVHTHIESSHGATCIRVVEMHNETTDVFLVRCKTKWCLLNQKSLKPIRISDEITELFV